MLKTQGQSIIELLVAAALMALIFPALFSGIIAGRDGRSMLEQRLNAFSLTREAEEASRMIRERNWHEIEVNGIYHPAVSGNSFVLNSGPETINGFTRTLTIADAFRDAAGALSASGTVDPSTKKVTVDVSWTLPHSGSISQNWYLTRFLNNGSHTETTVADFEKGNLTGTVISTDSGGEIMLGSGGTGSWCNPNLSIEAVDLPKNGVANAVSAIEGQVVAGTGNNASGVSFARVDISNPPPPSSPSGTINGTFDGYKTNDVFGEENYAYIATDTNSKEIVIMDLNNQVNGKFAEVCFFDAPGIADGKSVFTSGNIGFATAGNTLYTFNLDLKTGSRLKLGSIALAGKGEQVIVLGNYAYVAVESETTQMQIIEVTNGGQTLNIVGWANLNADDGKDIFVNSSATRAYLATEASSNKFELFVIDIENKSGLRPVVAVYEANGINPKGITVLPANRAILVGTGGEEYQVINISSESVNPPLSRCGGLNIDSGINGVFSVLETDGDAYSYIITGDSTSELKIIAGGPGGEYSSQGTFESAPFDAGQTVAFNRFDFNFDRPTQTSLALQVASSEAVNNNCSEAQYSYVGPDGAADTYFSADGPIPLIINLPYVNPGRCFRYKAELTSADSSFSPVLYDVSVNYSP